MQATCMFYCERKSMFIVIYYNIYMDICFDLLFCVYVMKLMSIKHCDTILFVLCYSVKYVEEMVTL